MKAAELRRYAPGVHVRSSYRARWSGVILTAPDDGECVTVRVTHDRCGHPMRKPETKRLHVHWLEILQT